MQCFFSHGSSFASLDLGDDIGIAYGKKSNTFWQLHLAVSEQQWYFFLTVLVFPVAFQFKNKGQFMIHAKIYIIQIVHSVYIYIAYKYTCCIILQYVIILRHIHIAYKYIDLYYLILSCHSILYHIVITYPGLPPPLK